MSALVLKIIAYATMLIDHVALVLWKTYPRLFQKGLGTAMTATEHYLLYRSIGRVAFPIFAFQLVEGARHTKCKWKYALRIAVVALISEIPFDIAIRRSFIDFAGQNIFFTLLLSLPALFLIQETVKMAGWKKIIGGALTFGALTICCFLADELNVDYGYNGVIMIFVMGALLIPQVSQIASFPKRNLIRTVICAVGILILSYLSGGIEYYALFALIPIFFYNEKKGYNKVGQIVFYAFYPVHLLLLGLFLVIPKLL